MSVGLVISNAVLVDPVGGIRTGSLAVAKDRIAAKAPDGADRIDAKGAHLAPGIVDLGVFSVDKAACIAGGITRVALMPDLSPPLDDRGTPLGPKYICYDETFQPERPTPVATWTAVDWPAKASRAAVRALSPRRARRRRGRHR